jgi:S-adenosylmethionine:tRNA ribosyltransferase-isomerase
VDAILSGVHEPGESHFELLRALTNDASLERVREAARTNGYRTHEFGDAVLIERPAA